MQKNIQWIYQWKQQKWHQTWLLTSDWMKRELFLLSLFSMDWLSFNFPSLWNLFPWEISRSKCHWPLQSSEMTEEDHLCEWKNNVNMREEINWNIVITGLSFYKKQMIVVSIKGMNFPLNKCRSTSFQSLVHLFNDSLHILFDDWSQCSSFSFSLFHQWKHIDINSNNHCLLISQDVDDIMFLIDSSFVIETK